MKHVIRMAVVLTSAAVLLLAPASVASASHGNCNNMWSMSKAAHAVPSIGTTGSAHCVMGQGAQGNHVRALQAGLVKCFRYDIGTSGPNGDGIDGIYGSRTTEAVKRMQRAAGFTGSDVDGVYGPKTRNEAMLFSLRNSSGSFTTSCLPWLP